ncbi:MAG: hypothetical protein P8046_00260 [Anaerolineales bacterium]
MKLITGLWNRIVGIMPGLALLLFISLILVGCGGSTPAETSTSLPTKQPTEVQAATPTTAQSQAAVPFQNRNIDPPALAQDSSDLVSASGNCAACHSGLQDANGSELSFDTLWRASMMGHAAKDPYWLATVGSETEEFSELEAVIADKCATCHMPLAHFDAQVNDQPTLILRDGFLNPGNLLHDLAMDGVSCNVCHQISGENFDQLESYSGGYLIDAVNRDWGSRFSYGPFAIDETNAQIMLQGSGYQTAQSEHITEAALCGTCHNLFTPYLDADNQIAGEFPEQTIYLEWQNSAFSGGGSCSSCHMPQVDEEPISNIAATIQPYLRKHSFTGANAFMLKLLKANAETTGITAEDGQMQAAIDRVMTQLSAPPNTVVRMGNVTLEEGLLDAEVTVSNGNGHKFPAGFPSRRVWLHVWVTDGSGETVFESGAVDADGRIVGNDNDTDPALYEPHYDLITDPEQVQIYEAIMHNTENEVTTTLLKASGYLKDNRMLPAGFSLAAVDPAIAPYGQVKEDENFVGGRDTIHYAVDVSQYAGPFTINFELYYQSIGYRWAENLRGYTNEQSQQFFALYDTADKTPILIGAAQHFQEE